MEYQIVKSGDLVNLESLVNFHLKEGWQLQGGVGSSGTWYFQDMVKKINLKL